MGRRRKCNKYIVNDDADRMMPKWLSARMDGENIRMEYRIVDGIAQVKGVKIKHEFAKIGDIIVFNGKRLSVERK